MTCVFGMKRVAFVLAKKEWLAPLLDVDLGEALGLLSALRLVHDLPLSIADFEVDYKIVVDSLYGSIYGVSNHSAVVNNYSRF